MRLKNMVMGPVGTETKNECAGKASSNVPDRLTDQQGQLVASQLPDSKDMSMELENSPLLEATA
jgi:hypothetical protein